MRALDISPFSARKRGNFYPCSFGRAEIQSPSGTLPAYFGLNPALDMPGTACIKPSPGFAPDRSFASLSGYRPFGRIYRSALKTCPLIWWSLTAVMLNAMTSAAASGRWNYTAVRRFGKTAMIGPLKNNPCMKSVTMKSSVRSQNITANGVTHAAKSNAYRRIHNDRHLGRWVGPLPQIETIAIESKME